ncbi:MAG TPA: NADH-quinone oxidoreductase subunit L [Pirellulales bacterium]|jgi:NADH-quinone oxidoreductase subunit L|nr:NADH-quinone oxidoreductase subunit L [Pirellulales bacterium]
MFDLDTLMVLIPAMPLAAAILTAVFGKHVLGHRAHWPTVVALVASFCCSLPVLFEVRRQAEEHGSSLAAEHGGGSPNGGAKLVGWEHTVNLWRWLHVDNVLTTPPAACETGHVADQPSTLPPGRLPFDVDVTLRVDPLTSIMLSMVTFIASLVAIYSIGYMHGDPGYWRFFSYIALFVFSMTMLVSVSNFVLLYVFWEAVGMCSYLLVGFWYEKPAAAAAGKKAFLVNRVGDFGFALGLFLIYVTYGTLNFHDVPGGLAGVLGQTRLESPGLYVGAGTATAIGLLLLVGACGKSAQFPLHVWLPDAMEGPTPVSALIHAATMVTAGVYMVTRCTPLYFQSAFAQDTVATIGTLTALMAGIIALTQTDLKRVLAYSTISQLGYMFLALGVGSLPGLCAGMFHLFTHAFFKALLFLGAGSVMHAMQTIDMRRFGGLRRLMPVTHWTFLFGCLALAGVFPWAGFWSKDAILAAAHLRAEHNLLFEILYWSGMVTAFLTALYTFRAYFLTFHGPERVPPEAGHHAHESPPAITIPLTILAFCALGVGAYFEYTGGFVDFLLRTPSLAFADLPEAGEVHKFHMNVALVSTAVALSGVGFAAFLYLGDQRQAAWLASTLRPLYSLSYGKFFFDQIYNVAFVWPLWLLAQLSFLVDRRLIDGLVNLVGRIPPACGTVVRSLQTGMVQFYALAMVLGVLVLLAGIFWKS